MILWCFGFSFAAPSFLGPEGLSHLGLGVGHHPRQEEIVVVDPKTGLLWVETEDGRVWKGDHWEGADAQNPNHRFVQSRLMAVHGDSGKQLYFYNEEGQLSLIRWANGEKARINYHRDGRVARIDAGTGALWNFTWGRALVVRQEGKATLRLSYEQRNEGYVLRVTESTGRTVESGYEENRLQYWIDPLGARTDLEWSKGVLKIRRDDGRLWQVGFDEENNRTSVTMPNLSAWVWKRDKDGALLSQIDPLGRMVNFETDDQGSVLSTSSSLATISYSRDGLGRLTKVDDALGVRMRLGWKDEELSSIRDATDGVVQFSYNRDGLLRQVIDRAGGRWILERDRDGLLVQVITPDQGVWSLRRDQAGRVQQLTTPFSSVMIGRNFQGLPTRLSLNGAEELSFVRDLAGNISAVRARDQVVQRWKWNYLDEPTEIWTPQHTLTLSRDRSGWPIAWSDIVCSRDSLGHVLSMTKGDSNFGFVRDAVGRVQTIQKGAYEIDITYDAHDAPLFWRESNGASTSVSRNERGKMTKGDEVELFYDAKGWVSKAQLGDNVWKWSRDVAGRVLQIVAPKGSKIGFDRSATGLLKFIRYPDSTIQRFLHTSEELEVRVIGSDSMLLEQIRYYWNKYGLIREKKKGNARTFFRRDPNLDIVAVERSDGLIWSQTPDGIRDGMNGKAIFSFDGEVIGVQPPNGSYPYEQDLGYLAYHRDEKGRISELIDVGAQAEFSYDALDRLRSICFRSQGCWKFFYDPRGMLSGFVSPGKKKSKLYWRPDLARGEFHRSVLLASGTSLWLQGPYGLSLAEHPEEVQSFLFDPMKKLTLILGKEQIQPYPSLSLSYIGDVAPIFGQSDELHLGAAGPVFRGDIAYEPFSGQRYDGSTFDQALYDEEFHRVPSLKFDATRNSFWRDPLALLEEIDVLPKLENHIAYEHNESLVQWLPTSYSSRGGIGFHGQDLFWGEDSDPLVNIFIDSVVRGREDPTKEEVLEHILQTEIDSFWGFSVLVDKIIWWNSDTNLDPRLANISFLE